MGNFNNNQSTNINIFEGELKDSKFNGKGVLIKFNGDKYDGEFQNGKYHGLGIITY